MPATKPADSSTAEPAILPALRDIQDRHGFLDRAALKRFATDAEVPLYRIQEVASFFPHFRLEKPPARTVAVCRDMACHMAGSAALRDRLERSAPAGLRVEGVSCLGRCDRAPVAWVASQDHDVEREGFVAERDVLELADASGAFNRDADQGRYPAPGWMINPYADATEHYACVRKYAAIARSNPAEKWQDQVLAEFDDAHASLRGLGGAGVPASQKWRDVLDAVGDARKRHRDDRAFIVVNGDESEPATFKDRELLLHFPHLIVEAVIVAGLVTGATAGFIYIRHEYPEQIAACRAEIARAKEAGVCGENAPALGRSFPVSVFVSPGGYICGEQSALIEAMSGRRGEPRNLPPKLETNGLHDLPTLVSNVETYAWVPYILTKSGKAYAELGVNGQKGRRFFSVCGDVARPGVYEVPMGLTLRELLTGGGYCGGIAGGAKLKAIAPSGPSGGFLPARLTAQAGLPRNHTQKSEWQQLAGRRGFDPQSRELDILDLELELNMFRALSPTQALGAGLVVYAEGRDMVAEAVNALQFFRNESCGKCVPCRVGSQKMANLGVEILAGRVDRATWDGTYTPAIKDLSEALNLASICGLGRSVPMPIRTVIDFFPGDLARYLG